MQSFDTEVLAHVDRKYDEARFEEICREFTEFAAKLDIPDLTFIPISALNGDNVTTHSDHMPWYCTPRAGRGFVVPAAPRAEPLAGAAVPPTGGVMVQL